MVENHFSIAQAVVTDPLSSSAGGYMLVAKSPSILSQDAEFLSASPGISDYLQELQATEESYFSFFTLPSKKYALVRRFIYGKRRGVNRVVVHMLVISNDFLHRIQNNIGLLIDSQFQAGDKTLSLTQLGEEVGQPGLDSSLPDLISQLPTGHFETLVAQRQQLLEQWSKDQLNHLLLGILETLVQKKWVLLPQDMKYRELLNFACFSLPFGDRARISWTTHFTPGSVLFRLANAPQPDGTRLLYPKKEECLLLKDIENLKIHDSFVTIGEHLMTNSPSELEALYSYLQDYKISLLDDAKLFARYVQSWNSDEVFRYFLEKGVSTLTTLSENLSEYESRVKHTKLLLDGLELNVLYAICQTGLNVSTSLGDIDEIVIKLDETVIKNHHNLVVEKCLEPALVANFITQYGSFKLAFIAMGLAWQRLPALPLSYNEHQRLFSAFFDKYQIKELGKAHNRTMLPFLAQICFELIIYYNNSSTTLNDLPALLSLQVIADNNPSVLDNTLVYIEKNKNNLSAAIALLKIAERVKRIDIIAEIMIRIIFPSMKYVPEQIILEGIDSTQGHPDVISHALKFCSGTPFDKALSQLKALIGKKPKDAKQIISKVLVGNLLSSSFDKSDEIKGITRELDKLELPIESLLHFLLVEAQWVVNRDFEENHFKNAIRHVITHKNADETRVILKKMTEILQDKEQYHKVAILLFECIAHKAAKVAPAPFYDIFEKLLSQNVEIDWESLVKDIFPLMQQKQWAARLAQIWWNKLSDQPWKVPNETELNMLELMGENEFLDIIGKWMPHIGEQRTNSKVVVLFKGLVDKFLKREHPKIYIEFAAQTIRRQKQAHAHMSLEEAANRLCSACYHLEHKLLNILYIFIENGFCVLFNKHEIRQLSKDYMNNPQLTPVIKLTLSEILSKNKRL